MKTFYRWFYCLPLLALLVSCVTKTVAPAAKVQTADAQGRQLVAEGGQYLANLARQGVLPGFRSGDMGSIWPSYEGLFDDKGKLSKPQITFPLTLTAYAYLSNAVTSITNAYYVTKDSQKAGWRLNGAWRWEHDKYVELDAADSEGAVQTNGQFVIEARINGKPAHLAIDTGSTDLILFSDAAARFGLSVTNAPTDSHPEPGHVAVGTTGPCDLTILGQTFKTRFHVFDIPAELDFDGMMGWAQLRHSILRIDARRGTVIWLESVPPDVATWTKLPVQTNSEVLQLKIPGGKGASAFIFVDTGNSDGVGLAAEQWHTWKAAHRMQPTTLACYYTPADGMVANEEAWAEKLKIGPLRITEVPVMEANKGSASHGTTTFGRAALNRLDVIIDGEHNVAYLRPRQSTPAAFPHNRAGAAFAPKDFHSTDLIAHVVKSSPAWNAGVRDGDVLLRIGDVDVTKWNTDPSIKLNTTFDNAPAGTRIVLTVKRGQKIFKAEVVLKDILTPTRRKTKA